jgi:hypothetical protein
MSDQERTVDGKRSTGRRAVAAGCGGLLVILLMFVFGYLNWANALPPREGSTRTLPNPNGYDACIAAAAKLSTFPESSALARPWRSDVNEVRKALQPRQQVLNELRQALRLPYLTPGAYDPNQPVGFFADYREAAREFSCEAQVALADGRRGEAVQRALDAVELGANTGKGGTLIHMLVGVACTQIGVAGAERCVDGLSAREARAAGARLDRIVAGFPNSGDVIDEERKYALEGLRDVFAGRQPLQTVAAAVGSAPNPGDRVKERLLLTVYPKSWGFRRVDRYYRGLAAELRKPYPQRTLTEPPDDPVLGQVGISGGHWALTHVRVETNLRILRLELALEEYRARHGRYPERLASLAPALLAREPLDGFTDQPFKYRRSANHYLLYSLGPNRKDDGGTPISFSSGISANSPGDLVAGSLTSNRRVRPGAGPR